MNISIAIMAHPRRRPQAAALYLALSETGFITRPIAYDQKNDEWDTGERALRTGIKTGSDWHVVLQDDAILPPDFYDHVVNALSAVPVKSLVSLYTGTARPFGKRVAAAVGKAQYCSWLRFNMLLWGVGIAIPTAHITEVLDFVADRQEVYDTRIGWAYQRNRLPVFYTNPSLVDHDDDLPSLLEQSANVSKADYQKEPRRAHNFIGDSLPTWNNRVLDI